MDNKITFSLLLLTLTGISHESLLGGELRCQCLQTVPGLVSPKLLVHVEIIPKGPQCSTMEVIATLKRSQQICLDPQAKWVKMIINRILRSSSGRPRK
ncbi:alveolar macrophage chemotactic factor-like [Mauremys mutica]|uniref:alveolar macrophage chemotactic factor-like n=1 Tax=Mauremys mutica TaxID=74926 RepID=UPI001D161E37|nr:alveolar macrophage chemotactic factor-like [Mauremys mutica]